VFLHALGVPGEHVPPDGTLQAWRRDLDGARDLFRHTMLLYRSLGEERGGARALTNLGDVALQTGDLTEAREYWTEARDVFCGFGDLESASQVERWLAELDRQR
jgi:catechol-2,3-dioxygenase